MLINWYHFHNIFDLWNSSLQNLKIEFLKIKNVPDVREEKNKNFLYRLYKQLKEHKTVTILGTWGFPGGTVVKNMLASVRDMGLIPGSERFPGEGPGNIL